MNKTSTLLTGFGVAALVLIVIAVVLGRANVKPTPEPVAEGVTTEDLTQMQSQTAGLDLRNFGNLPKTVTNDEIGKSDPFGSY